MRRNPLYQLLLMRLRIFRREPEALFWTFGFPLVVILVLGIAFRPREPEKLPVAVVRGAGVERVLEVLRGTGELEVRLVDAAEGATALGRGGALLVVEPGEPPVLRFDPSRPESRLARALTEGALAGRAPLASVSRPSAVPGDRYVDFLVPGLVGMNVMTVCLWGIGWNVVEARGRRLLRRLAVTPMRRIHFLGSFVLAHVALVLITLAVVMGFAAVAFDVRIAGSVASLVLLTCLGAAAFSAVGALVASRTANVEVLSGMINAVSLIQIVGSGVFFSTQHFPEPVALAVRGLPLTALVDGLRAVALEGRSLVEVPVEVGVLAAWTILGGALGLRFFRWS